VIQLRAVTEHSGRRGAGTVEDLVGVGRPSGTVALTDATAFGHVAFQKACLAASMEPIFGLARPDGVVLLAHGNHTNLEPLYRGDLDGCIVLLPWNRDHNALGLRHHPYQFWMVDPASPREEIEGADLEYCVAVSRAKCVLPSQAALQQLSSGSVGNHLPTHLLSDAEFLNYHPNTGDELITNAAKVARLCFGVRLSVAASPQPSEEPEAFRELAERALRHRLAGRDSLNYDPRLQRELDLVQERGFQGYFEVVSEAVLWAKAQGIRVGPGRGSACGSLLCWALGITEIDPLPHGLLFERFLDPSRPDLPDVDLDFQEDRRDEVIAHLVAEYGEERVARVGSTLRRGGRAALADGLRALKLPLTPELKAVSESVEVRLAGEEGSPDTLAQALAHAGISDPEVLACCKLEGTVSAHGKHAAGVVVAPDALARYARTVDGVAEADLHDVEALGLLKLDCLGLRTLSVLDASCRSAGVDWESLPGPQAITEADLLPLREGRLAGVFQFEGGALKGLTAQAPPSGFDDVALLTAVARPGPLQAGTGEELKRIRKGSRVATSPMWSHLPLLARATADADGLLVYQEQVMGLFRELGFDWPTVARVRKAMAKSQGRGGMEAFEREFLDRGLAKGHGPEELVETWEALVGCGAYLFNKAHAVAYALVSCWCSHLKAQYPEAFYAAALNRARDVEDGLTLIREARGAGLTVTLFDPATADLAWRWEPGHLIGGWQNLPGVGEKRARDLMDRRRRGALTDLQLKLIEGLTVYDERFGDLDILRAEARALTVTRMRELRGGLVAGRLAEAKCLDWTTPKAVKKYGAAKPGRERSWVLKLVDDEAEVEVRVSGKLVSRLEPQVKELVVGMPCVLAVSHFDKDGRFYLQEVL
jgi:DNA polymerase III alpha subunit